MVTRKYGIYLRVFRSISILTRDDKLHVSKHPSFILFIIKTYQLRFFDDFPDVSDQFPKIYEDFQIVVRRSYECFRIDFLCKFN